VGGAAVDQDLWPGRAFDVPSFKQQVNDIFLPAYTGATPTAPDSPNWQSSDTLFLVWIGINDVNLYSMHSGGQASAELEATMDNIYIEYLATLHRLIEAGARTLVLLNVPPLERAPWNSWKERHEVEKQRKLVLAFNAQVMAMVESLRLEYGTQELSIAVADTWQLFGKVMDDPSVTVETSRYKDTTGWCQENPS
jgi:phospholipase/lecithinase/hemolysin